ncbi:inositol 1,4,5-triphosphate receptor associated 2-like isoform X1 [Anser cygnoides]|uniref:inositol 1,4,5-triphosphate receptor associated 2-like isoform X1 n=1 Tax=Anser cygnoides TaxID=8845 RepID=UPI0034D31BAA
MKPLAGTSPGAGEEAQGRAQGRAARQRHRRGCRQSPPARREQQAEPAGLPASPDEGRMSSPQGHPDGVVAGSEQSVERVSEEPGKDRQELAVRTGDSDRTEEDAETLEEPLLSFPGELSVLERLGLQSVALTEQDVEAAFAHLALAFRCDVFTLRQRVQVEKRARDAAEENIQEELGQCRAALERLGASCADTGCRETLEQLQHSLAVLAAAVERATSAAEKLGAVHQEARMSRAAEVMVQHVENLKRHHLREHAELEEMKRLIQQNSRNRQLAETQDDAEPRLRPHPLMRSFQQGLAGRRPFSSTSSNSALVPLQLKRRLPAAESASPSSPSSSWCQHGRPSVPRQRAGGVPAPGQHPEERAGATGPGRRRERGAGGWGGRQGHERRGRGAGAAWADVSAPQILPAASGGGGSVVPKRPARGDGAGGLGDGGQGWFVAASPRPCLSFPVHCR